MHIHTSLLRHRKKYTLDQCTAQTPFFAENEKFNCHEFSVEPCCCFSVEEFSFVMVNDFVEFILKGCCIKNKTRENSVFSVNTAFGNAPSSSSFYL